MNFEEIQKPFSFARSNAAQRFVIAFMNETFQLACRPHRSALFDLGNGYFVRLFAQNGCQDARKGSFLFAPYVMKQNGTLQPIRVESHGENRYGLYEDVACGGRLFLRVEKNMQGYCDAPKPVSISFAKAASIMERMAIYPQSTGSNVHVQDPEFSALRLSDMPWRTASPYKRPIMIQLVETCPLVKTDEGRMTVHGLAAIQNQTSAVRSASPA